MRNALRTLVIAGATAAVVAVTALPAAAKEVSTAKYAKAVCGTYSDIQDKLKGFTDAYNALPSDDPANFQLQAVALTNTLLEDIGSLKTKLSKQWPDVDDGKRITKLFVKNMNEIDDEISTALQTFQTADASGAAFQGDITTFEVAINLLDTKTSDPFSKVKDQDVIGAFGDEKSCKSVVTVIGG
jgi:hypothetical protein